MRALLLLTITLLVVGCAGPGMAPIEGGAAGAPAQVAASAQVAAPATPTAEARRPVPGPVGTMATGAQEVGLGVVLAQWRPRQANQLVVVDPATGRPLPGLAPIPYARAYYLGLLCRPQPPGRGSHDARNLRTVCRGHTLPARG